MFELEKEIHYDKYFLFDIDVPWVADGLRDLDNQRKEMLNIFENELTKRNIQYVRVNGIGRRGRKLSRQQLTYSLNLIQQFSLAKNLCQSELQPNSMHWNKISKRS